VFSFFKRNYIFLRILGKNKDQGGKTQLSLLPMSGSNKKPPDASHPGAFCWSHPGDSNSRPMHYECIALPAELGWQNCL
jgi:hypothetical protein